MKIVFVSNNFNHHESPFCDALYRLVCDDFRFVQTQPMRAERVNMGWGVDVDKIPYCVCSYGDDSAYENALDLCNNADVVIIGSAPYEFIADRVRNNKLTFFYAERLFRKGLWHMLFPPTFFTVLKRFILPGRKSNFYLLCASAYTAVDTHKIFAFNEHRFKWGHFIEIAEEPTDIVKNKLSFHGLKHPQDVSILWAGRLIGLKHPDMSVRLARTLKSNNIPFQLNIIGNGALEDELKRMIKEFQLEDCVKMLGPMKPTEVRKYMEESDIYLFTSDFNEGWGAVLGESMSSGCAVVASHGIGATPFLVQHGVNGLIYETGKYESFERNALKLVEDKSLRMRLGANAHQTMQQLWNPKVAAERFATLCDCLLNNKELPSYEQGPISRASVLKNNWFKDDTI